LESTVSKHCCHRFNPEQSYPLLSVKDTRALEPQLQSQISPTEPTLIQHAGRSVAQLAMALAPHAHVFWVACGPGLNGADGLAAADDLKQRGKTVWVTRAQDQSPPPVDCEVCIDALLATAGTGDVLSGWIGAYMAQGLEAYGAACAAVWSHGWVADHWNLDTQGPLTASKLACASSGA
jgi:NAD(P)H-hydrate repair Nnr-like enzyme with NAD(P)H-hydrate dehydratase domain